MQPSRALPPLGHKLLWKQQRFSFFFFFFLWSRYIEHRTTSGLLDTLCKQPLNAIVELHGQPNGIYVHLGDTPVGMSGRVLRGRFNWKGQPHPECCFYCLVDIDPRLRKKEKNGRDQLNMHLSLYTNQNPNISVRFTRASVPSLPWRPLLSGCEPGWTLLPAPPCPSFASAAVIKYSDGKEVKGGRGLIHLKLPGYSSQLEGGHRGRNRKEHVTAQAQ